MIQEQMLAPRLIVLEWANDVLNLASQRDAIRIMSAFNREFRRHLDRSYWYTPFWDRQIGRPNFPGILFDMERDTLVFAYDEAWRVFERHPGYTSISRTFNELRYIAVNATLARNPFITGRMRNFMRLGG